MSFYVKKQDDEVFHQQRINKKTHHIKLQRYLKNPVTYFFKKVCDFFHISLEKGQTCLYNKNCKRYVKHFTIYVNKFTISYFL
ncbi:hypothetical protein CBE79_08815 [Priestia megaterium]|nr:hypothetical protein CBE78_06305 [Priestia megaterium]TPF22936.1 hypothetical protein CBE79_08815 [Priestia megaterium]